MTEITARLSTALADRYKIEREIGEGKGTTRLQVERGHAPQRNGVRLPRNPRYKIEILTPR